MPVKIALSVCLVFFLSNNLLSQTEPLEINKKFFSIYKLSDSDKAIDYLFSTSPYVDEIQDAISDVKTKLKRQIGQEGLCYGEDLLSTRTAGPNVVLYTYLVRHAREPLTFSIMYYRPNGKWQLQSFKYKAETDDELEEAGKAYRLKENY